MDFQNVLQDLPLFVNYARIEDFQTAQRPTDRGGGGIGDFKKLVIAKYGKISAAQKVRNWHQLTLRSQIEGYTLGVSPSLVSRWREAYSFGGI